ncbi:unnamed protein product [Heterobilharzia americana]|nr:unnamed protein product [Heterobilharzia americana]
MSLFFQSPGTFHSFHTFCSSGENMSTVVSSSVLSASVRISSGSAAFPDFSSVLAFRTLTSVGGFMFVCSSKAGLQMVFLDEVQVVADSKASGSGQSIVFFVSLLYLFSFRRRLLLVSSALTSYQIATWLLDIMLSGLSLLPTACSTSLVSVS